MFSPSSEVATLAKHASQMFHVAIGLDPLGDFMSVEGLSYELPAFEYSELGRNHSKLVLPFDEPGKVGEVTLKWGMIIRSKLFKWIESVEAGEDFVKTVYIYQLSRKRLPLRVYTLSGCWPTSWNASELTQEASTLSTEEVKLQCDQIRMTNLSAIAVAAGAFDLLQLWGDGQGGTDSSELQNVRSWERTGKSMPSEPLQFTLPQFDGLESGDGGEFDFVFKGLPREYVLAERPPDPRQFALHFRFANPDHNYVPSGRSIDYSRRANVYEAEEGGPMESRPFYTPGEGGEVEEAPERKRYEAAVGDWGDAVRLDRTYEAQAGDIGFYEDGEEG